MCEAGRLRGEITLPESQPEIRIVENAVALAETAAEEFLAAADDAISAHGRFTVALSGGSTPRRLYEQLASADATGRANLWAAAHIFWGDERFVPPDHPDSNYGMAREALLDRIELPAEQIHRIATGAGDVVAAAGSYEDDLRSFFSPAAGKVPRFDLVLLGLGSDGHTASLFPGSTAVRERTRWSVGHAVAGIPHSRVTLTFPVLNNAARVVFLVSGSGKADALHSVLEGSDPIDRIPARGVRPRSGRLLWLVDRVAACRIQRP